MTNQEIAQWVREWMNNHPKCKELDSMYDDFRRYGADRFDIGALTKLIYGMNPLKYMTSIPDGMFFDGDCTDVIIPNNIKSIGNSAFWYCSSLTRVTIPDSVTRIGKGAFAYCDSLMEINFTGTKSQWNSIQLGKSWDAQLSISVIKCIDGIITL